MASLYAAIWAALAQNDGWFIGLMVLTSVGSTFAIRRAVDRPPPVPHLLRAKGETRGVVIFTAFCGFLALAEVVSWLLMRH
jgi:hypothetical protein